MSEENIEQKVEDVVHEVERELHKDIAAIEDSLRPVFEKLKPIAEEDLKALLQIGTDAAQAFIANGGNLTLTAVEGALIVGCRAIASHAATTGLDLTRQAVHLLVTAAPAPENMTEK